MDLSVTTFATLDRAKGYSPLPELSGDEWPLQAWFRSVYHTPLDQLTVGDLSKAARQDVHREQIVPLIIARLWEDPMAGYILDGEMFAALRDFPVAYWKANPTHAVAIENVIDAFRNGLPEDVQAYTDEILRMLARAQ